MAIGRCARREFAARCKIRPWGPGESSFTTSPAQNSGSGRTFGRASQINHPCCFDKEMLVTAPPLGVPTCLISSLPRPPCRTLYCRTLYSSGSTLPQCSMGCSAAVSASAKPSSTRPWTSDKIVRSWAIVAERIRAARLFGSCAKTRARNHSASFKLVSVSENRPRFGEVGSP